MYAAAANCQPIKISSHFLYVEMTGDYGTDLPLKPTIDVMFANSGYACVVSITTKGAKTKQYIKVDVSKSYSIITAYKTIIYGDITSILYNDAYASSPGLKNIKTDELPNLEVLTLSGPKNLISQLDVSKNIKLKKLTLGTASVSLKEFDLNLSKNTELSHLRLNDIPLTTLDLSKNTELEELYCNYSQLTGLSLNKNTKLQTLSCRNNEKLTKLECKSKVLETLTIIENPAIETINISESALTSISLSDCTELNKLTCKNGKLGSIDLSNNTKLKEIYLQDNELKGIMLPYAPSADNTTLTSINIENNWLSAIGVYPYIGLKKLNCSGNKLTALNVGKNVALQELLCNKNALTIIDCGALENLTRLECTGNQLQVLDITNAVALSTLLVATSKAIANQLETIMCYKTSAEAYSSLNDNFDYFAEVGKLMTDDTEESATLRATATAKGWDVIVEPVNN